MVKSVRWEARALDDMRRAGRGDPETPRRIGRAVTRSAETEHGDVLPLRGRAGEWRLRVGDWRLLFFVDEVANAIVVTRVLRRNEGTYRT